MVGNPGETPETILETSRLMYEIRPTTMPTMGINTLLPAPVRNMMQLKHKASFKTNTGSPTMLLLCIRENTTLMTSSICKFF